ncbi:MAG: hypothetical protein ACOC37_03255, partial [Spirochaetota bacterium]
MTAPTTERAEATQPAPQPGTDQQPPEPKGPGFLKRFWGEQKNRLLTLMAGVFLVAFFVPWSAPRVSAAVNEAFLMLGEY